MRLGDGDDEEDQNEPNANQATATAYSNMANNVNRKYLLIAGVLFMFMFLKSAGQRDYRADAEKYLRSVGRGEDTHCQAACLPNLPTCLPA